MPSKSTASSIAGNDGTTTGRAWTTLPPNTGQETAEAAAVLQKDLVEVYEEASSAWLTRVQSEVALWSQLSAKLASSRSIPEALQAFTESTSQRMKMTAEDGQRLINDYQRITEKLIRSWTTQWPK